MDAIHPIYRSYPGATNQDQLTLNLKISLRIPIHRTQIALNGTYLIRGSFSQRFVPVAVYRLASLTTTEIT